MAGTGKSTIALTIAHNLNKEKRLGASFFFSRGQNDLSSCKKLITSLAANLADNSPSLKPCICDALRKNSEIATKFLPDQWRALIFEPLKNSPQSPTIILVIDALDECEGKGDIELILQFLDKGKDFYFYGLRVLVTSRHVTPIRSRSGTLGEISPDAYEEFSLNALDNELITRDISIFIDSGLYIIQEKRQDCDEMRDKLIKRNKLIKGANGLFIWADIACRFIAGSPRGFLDRYLSIILDGKIAKHSPTSHLDQLYTDVLKSSLDEACDEEVKEEMKRKFKWILGPIAILFDPLSLASLAKLLDVPEGEWRVEDVLEPLFAVLDISPSQHSAAQLHHPSFRDFLFDKKRSEDFWVDKKQAHHTLGMRCLRLMSDNLKRDICDLQIPGALISKLEISVVERFLPLHIQYACRYWVQHLEKSRLYLHDDGPVHIFLQEHLLHWFEALSLIGKTSESILAINLLESIIEVSVKP